MRSIWNGSLSFGLVTIPVGLAVAQQRQDVSFRTLHRECGTPIKQKRFCPTHDREVAADELVKGWEFAKGQFVLVEESDLESVALQRSRSIELLRFVELAEVDPVFFDRAYYLSPADDDVARRPYVLLLETLRETGMAAVGRFVLWGRENLCLVRASDGALVLETLYFAEDVRSADEIRHAVSEIEVKDDELSVARQLVESLAGSFTPEDFVNEHRAQLRAMLESKRDGEEIVVAEDVEQVAPVIDIMDALKESLARAKKDAPSKTESNSATKPAKKTSRKKKAPARK
ncbi:MAG: Ku protein [Gaiellaceae bacterium]